jgi:hypothetical protein
VPGLLLLQHYPRQAALVQAWQQLQQLAVQQLGLVGVAARLVQLLILVRSSTLLVGSAWTLHR